MSVHSHSHHEHHHEVHGHSHHDHSGAGHSHAPKANAKNLRRIGIAAVLTGLFMIVEVIGGVVSGSLALLADAGHMMTDFAALAMAWGAFIIAKRPANWRLSYGYDRVSILVAFVNGLTLFVLALWIIWEAVAAIAAAIIILLTGWVLADPILSVLVALLILRSAWALIGDSAHVLLQGAPEGLDKREIEADLLANIPDLIRLEHIHIWSVTPERPVLTLNAFIQPDKKIEPVAEQIRARIHKVFHIDHATIDVMRDPN